MPKTGDGTQCKRSEIGIVYYLAYGNAGSAFYFGIFLLPHQSTSVANIQLVVLLSGFIPSVPVSYL